LTAVLHSWLSYSIGARSEGIQPVQWVTL